MTQKKIRLKESEPVIINDLNAATIPEALNMKESDMRDLHKQLKKILGDSKTIVEAAVVILNTFTGNKRIALISYILSGFLDGAERHMTEKAVKKMIQMLAKNMDDEDGDI